MADSELSPALEPEQHSEEEEEEEEDLEELELQVKQMVERIRHHRKTLPDQIKKTLDSLLVAQRPNLPSSAQIFSDLVVAGDRNPDAGETAMSSVLAEEDPQTAEKIRLLKLKITGNVSAMPVVLKRMNDCIARINKLDMHNVTLHPAFKRKRTW